MSTQLIAEAVFNQRGTDETSIWDRVFAIWFRHLVYAQIWEDPEADLAALQLSPHARIVTISSAGCNALSYLTAMPQQIYAVDLNEVHLALLNLKIAGLRGFADYDTYWRFFGAANLPENGALYRSVLRPLLDPAARAYWDARDLIGRPHYRYFCDGFHRHGTLGRFIGFAHVLARLFGVDLQALLRAKDDPARKQALARIDNMFQSRLARLLAKSPALLFSLGIPPRQRELLTAGDVRLNDVLRARLLRLIDHFPAATNYFAWQALQRRYPGPGNRCLPLYLQQQHFDRIRAQAQSVTPIHANVRTLLEALPTRHIDAVILLDSQDWMAPQEIQSLWQAIDRAGTGDVRVIFRTAGKGSPLEEPGLAPLRTTWQRDAQRSELGFANDRSATYGGFHLYRRR
jgi:S-adenosylmethionine-diacylglycerol 3-amino-3-carboxypropyl transferase